MIRKCSHFSSSFRVRLCNPHLCLPTPLNMALLLSARVFVALLTFGLGSRVQPELKHESAKSGANASVAACVDKDSSFCRSDNKWYYQSGQCCTKDTRAYVTCKKASDSSFCKGPDWKYMGRGQCCTTAWTECEQATDSSFCKGPGYSYLGQGLCCVTSSEKVYLTCQISTDMSFCKRGASWQYLGGGKCCTTEWSTCVDGADSSKCKGDRLSYLGGGKCCVTGSSYYVKPTCAEGTSDFCKGYPWKYVGGSKCCASKQASCEKYYESSRCSNQGGYYLGNGNCCWNS
eukprot:s525_g19.t3